MAIIHVYSMTDLLNALVAIQAGDIIQCHDGTYLIAQNIEFPASAYSIVGNVENESLVNFDFANQEYKLSFSSDVEVSCVRFLRGLNTTYFSGPISITDGSPVISGCRFCECITRTGNESSASVHVSGGAPHIQACRFDGNIVGETDAYSGMGAVVSMAGGACKISDCDFIGNTVFGSGLDDGAYSSVVRFGLGTHEFSDNDVVLNISSAAYGTSGLFLGVGGVSTGTHSISGNRFELNEQSGLGGCGALRFHRQNGLCEITRNRFLRNKGSNDCGGVTRMTHSYDQAGDGPHIFSGNQYIENVVTGTLVGGDAAGAVYVYRGSRALFSGEIFNGNAVSVNRGGGHVTCHPGDTTVYEPEGLEPTVCDIRNSVMLNGTASETTVGAGSVLLYHYLNEVGSVTIDNVTMIGNAAQSVTTFACGVLATSPTGTGTHNVVIRNSAIDGVVPVLCQSGVTYTSSKNWLSVYDAGDGTNIKTTEDNTEQKIFANLTNEYAGAPGAGKFFQARSVVTPAQIALSVAKSSKVRIGISAATHNCIVKSSSFGPSSGDSQIFSSAPTQLKFSGLDGVTIPAGTTMWSDWFDFEYGNSAKYIVHVTILPAGDGKAYCARVAEYSNSYTLTSSAVDDVTTLSVSYNYSSNFYCWAGIEVGLPIDPKIGVDGKLSELSFLTHTGSVIAGVNDGGEIDPWGNATPSAPNIGADQGAAKGFGPWTPFDGTMPTLSLSPTAPGDLRSVQTWSKVASAKEIERY